MFTVPVAEIAFTVKQVAGMAEGLSAGDYGELSEDLVDAILEEAGKFASEEIAPVVGGIGLMGSLSISVVERIREIGVMRAIGAKEVRRDFGTTESLRPTKAIGASSTLDVDASCVATTGLASVSSIEQQGCP